MRIIRLGAHGMLRNQNGTWFNANHFLSFYIENPDKNEWQIVGDISSGTYVVLGRFDTKKEAQENLDHLFGVEKSQCW